MSYGEELQEINEVLNEFMQTGSFSGNLGVMQIDLERVRLEELIEVAAGSLSKELLYMKFLQSIPVVGAAGGAYDAVYMQKIVEYAKIKYQRRFLLKRIEGR